VPQKNSALDSLLKNANNKRSRKPNLREIKGVFTEDVQAEVNRWKSAEINRNSEIELPFQVLDFFCGCGGMSLGFAAVSKLLPILEIVGGCDIEVDALATYEKNFDAPGVNMDIRELAQSDAALEDFLRRIPRFNRSRRTILIGCAPCQGFSSHRKRHWNKEDDRNTLLSAFATAAIKINPECIIMENVPEMLSKKYWGHYEAARTAFEEAGYIVSQAIYNAASFGVPQDRFRALVIATKRPILLPTPQLLAPDLYKTVRSAIEYLPRVSAGEPDPDDRLHRSAAHRESTLRTIRAIPKDGGSRPAGVGPKCLDRVHGFYDVYGRLAWDKPAITITHYARNPASGRYVHPEQDRGLTTREAAILQSFPRGFEFCGSFDSIFKQIGEAVPPQFAAAIAAHCIVELLSSKPTANELKNSIRPITSPVSSSFSSVIAGMKMSRNRK